MIFGVARAFGSSCQFPKLSEGWFGFVWNDSKGMVPLAYLVGLIGMFLTAMSYASMSRAFPLAGSVYTYAHAVVRIVLV